MPVVSLHEVAGAVIVQPPEVFGAVRLTTQLVGAGPVTPLTEIVTLLASADAVADAAKEPMTAAVAFPLVSR